MQFSTGVFSIGNAIGSVLSSLGSVAVPPTCLTCDRLLEKQGGCCATCWNEFHFIHEPYCPVMGTPFEYDLGEGMVSLEAITDPPPFKRLRACVAYSKLSRQLVTQLKFSDRTDLAPWMGAWMAVSGKQLIEECDVLIPVPLHKMRLLQRRYNQSAELGRAIASESEIEFRPQALMRKRKTKQQTGLTEKERSRNVSGAFQVPDAERISVSGKRVLLVDDVYTTGSTAKAATRALKRAGAASVDVLVFSKVEKGRD